MKGAASTKFPEKQLRKFGTRRRESNVQKGTTLEAGNDQISGRKLMRVFSKKKC